MDEKIEYEQSEDGDVDEIAPYTLYFVVCCDCGLVHRIRTTDRTDLQWNREPERTKVYRKKFREQLTHAPKRV